MVWFPLFVLFGIMLEFRVFTQPDGWKRAQGLSVMTREDSRLLVRMSDEDLMDDLLSENWNGLAGLLLSCSWRMAPR